MNIKKIFSFRKKYYILNYNELKNGDIILTCNKTAAGKIVMQATKSKFSHAAIYFDQSIIESTGNGVFSCNPQRILMKSPQKFCVLRSKQELDETEINKIRLFVREKIGTPYSCLEAVKTQLPNLFPKIQTGRRLQFCSRFVAQAYAAIGIKIVKNPDYCSPADILHSDKLTIIENIVYPASEDEIKFAKSKNPVTEHLKHFNYWIVKVRKIAQKEGKKIITENDLFPFLTEFPEYDSKIFSCIKKSGYAEDYKIECKNNPYRFDTELFLKKYLPAQDLQEILLLELKKENEVIPRYGINYLQTLLMISGYGNLKTFCLYSNMYLELLKISKRKIEVLYEVAMETNPELQEIIMDQLELLTVLTDDNLQNEYDLNELSDFMYNYYSGC